MISVIKLSTLILLRLLILNDMLPPFTARKSSPASLGQFFNIDVPGVPVFIFLILDEDGLGLAEPE